MSAPTSIAPLVREQTIGTDRAIVLEGCLVLVASTSEPGTWHRVTNGACDCKSYQYRSRCRHIAVALDARAQLVTCHRCGAPARPSAVGAPICTACSMTLAWAVD